MAFVHLLDSRDSFTWNLAQAFAELGVETQVQLVDDVRVEELRATRPNLICIGPGPRGPDELPWLVELSRTLSMEFPVFGVCLGLQALVLAHGGRVERASHPVHGKRTPISHAGSFFFQGLPNPLWVMRYHSLVASRVPADFEVIARDELGQTMAVMRRARPYCAAVQFHPESIGTSGGMQLLRGVLEEVGVSVPAASARAGSIPPPHHIGATVQLFEGTRS